MSTGIVRLERGERAWMQVRLVNLIDLGLLAPTMAMLITGGYSRGVFSLLGAFFLSLLSIGLIRWSIGRETALGVGGDLRTALLCGLALLTATYAVVELSGVHRSYLFAVILASIAFLVAFNERRNTAFLVATAISFEVLLWLSTSGGANARGGGEVVTNVALILLIAGLARVPEHSTALRSKGGSPRRSIRSRGKGSAVGVDITEMSSDSALVQTALPIVNQICSAQMTCLLQIEPGSRQLRAIAGTDPDSIGTRVPTNVGIQASTIRSGKAVLANNLRIDFPGTLTCPDGSPPLHVMCAPITQGRNKLGLLLVQRSAPKPFGSEDLENLELSVPLISNALISEQFVSHVTNAYGELERFFAASRLMNSALSPDQVYESAEKALATISDFDFSAITWIDNLDGIHRIVHGTRLEKLGETVDPDKSLAAMVVKNGHYLPIGCDFRQSVPVLSASEDLSSLQSIIVLPLRVHDRIKGVLAIGSCYVDAFYDQRRGILEVIANQVAVSLANAWTYAEVQEMAVTDALTGLFNRRSFRKRLDEALARAERSGSSICLVQFDVDHFKNINDSYGHPCGDTVLVTLSSATQELMRRTDIAARVGGEEFALILEDTDLEGGLVIAERLREIAAALEFTSPKGEEFSLTMSLGVASYPQDSKSAEEIIAVSDQALYRAKNGGRNQTCTPERKSRPKRQRRHVPRPDPTPADVSGLPLFDNQPAR